MHTIDIYRAGSLFATIKPDNNATQSTQVMGEDVLRVSFTDSRSLDFTIGDYCDVFGTRYTLNALPGVDKEGSRRYEYSLQFEGPYANLGKVQFQFLNPVNNLTEGDFSLMGNPDTFMRLLLQNVERCFPGWTLGQVIAGPYKALTFSKENCYNALGRLAEAFDTEFWIEGQTIHLTRRRRQTALLFRHGPNKGLYKITRTNFNNSSVATRLYVYGSDKNLPADYRGGTRRLALPTGDNVVESFQGVVDYGIIEATEILDDVYPHRTGVLTAVNAAEPKQFVDALIDFDVNSYLLPGLTAKITFNTGDLAGYTFDIESFNFSTKTFTILKNKNERIYELPSSTMRPRIGDQYVITDIKMPQSYIDAAEATLEARAQALLDVVSKPQVSYSIEIDPTFIARHNISLAIGDEVTVSDAQLHIDSRIRVSKVTRNLVEENRYQVELADIVSPSTLSRILSAQYEADRGLNQLAASVQNNALLNGNVIGSLNFSGLPVAPGTSGFTELVIELATGKLFRKA